MTYASGNLIQTADFNTLFLGPGQSSAAAYSDPYACMKKIAAIIGVGYGDCGYGQVASPITPLTSANVNITSAEWKNAINKLATVRNYLGHNTAANPTPAAPVAGDVVSYLSTIQAQMDACYNSRFFPAAGNMSLVGAGAWAAGQWSSNANFSIVVSFTSEDHARSFFNAGGEIRLAMSHPNADASSQNQVWKSITEGLFNQVIVSALSSIFAGSGSSKGIGFSYYSLPTTDTLIFNGVDVGSGVYTGADLLVYARVANKAGLNGANGATMVFTFALSDPHTNGWYDRVLSGLQVAAYVNKPNQHVVVAAPTITASVSYA